MNSNPSGPPAELSQNLVDRLAFKRIIPDPRCEILEEHSTGAPLVRIFGNLHRLVRSEPLGFGFSLWLLGAGYEMAARRGRAWPEPLAAVYEKDKSRTSFHLVSFAQPGQPGAALPLFTLMRDDSGNYHCVENLTGADGAFWAPFIFAAHLLGARSEDPSRFDSLGDFQTLGAPSIVQRHSTERLRKHIAQKVTYDTLLCTHCLHCVTACNEMRAAVGEKGMRLLGPSEDFCTNCGLCRKRCTYLTARPKESLGRVLDPLRRIDDGGAGVYVYGPLAGSCLQTLQGANDEGSPRFPYGIRTAFGTSHEFSEVFPAAAQIELSLDPELPFAGRRSLLATVFNGSAAGPERLLFRPLYRATVVLQTESGNVEMAIARAAVKAGMLPALAAPLGEGDFSFPVNEATKIFSRMKGFGREDLADLWEKGAADLFLAPYADKVPLDLQQRILEETGRQAQVIAPHILQALPFTRNPVLSALNADLAAIFAGTPELLEAEAARARELLADIPRNNTYLHARYRPMAIASGHSACPTCAEAQVLALPVYMSVAMSLARGEIPQISFTCETGCMSETLNKAGEAAQKFPGGRTVFGGGFAFGEAIAMAQDRAMREGRLPKQRRYVVSQSGDGGSVIGLPAWLNALRQQAFTIRQRYQNTLHFINITDTQVYSNTGGESSASSIVGMGTLTTPIGKFLLGNQKVQWTLINLAAEFPGVLVGSGHSADRIAMQQFWHLADRLGQSGIRWDVTPCPETGKFFGEDPDDLAEVMAHAGMIPEVVFCGRFRKRVAPYHPEDRARPFSEWRRDPKPVLYWLQRDPRYRSLLLIDPQTGKAEPRNAVAHFLVTQIESFRDQQNAQIDVETRIVRQAEEWVRSFFGELKETWKRYRYRPEQFPHAFLFNREGELKPEYAASLEHELVRRVLGWEALQSHAAGRDQVMESQQSHIRKMLAGIDQIEKESEKLEASEEPLARIRELNEALKKELAALQESVPVVTDPVEEELFSLAAGRTPQSLPEARREHLFRTLDRILEERALATQAELQQYRLSRKLKQEFLKEGGLIRSNPPAKAASEREEMRGRIASLGPFSVGVASLAGDRGIAINRIFAHFLTAKGAWAGTAWQFGSSKRGTPVLSATFASSKPLHRKDAMYSFPTAVIGVTNFEEIKAQPDTLFGQLHPRGTVIINHWKSPEVLWRELTAGYPEEVRSGVHRLRQRLAERKQSGWEGPPDSDALLEAAAETVWIRPLDKLSGEQRKLAAKVAAIAGARVVGIDMDGIMRRVSGSTRLVSNLVAVGPMFEALRQFGLPLDWDRDLPTLIQGFPEAVLKNARMLEHYRLAMEEAKKQFKTETVSFRFLGEDGPAELRDDAPPPQRAPALAADPGEHLMTMGGTLAGMALSQIATAESPLFYVGFPITPAGNPFYAMAEAFANGHPYIVVDEVNPSEKVAAEKLLGIARTGGYLPVTFTASQGWRLFTEIIPQFVGARLEGIFLLAKRALAAPNLNIEESHTDFMSFRDDGGIMLAPKSIQEFVPSLYLARLLTHFAKLPVILSIGGITDTHKIGLVKVPPDVKVRAWLQETLRGFDFLEHKMLNRQGQIVVHGPSCTAAAYQETQSDVEQAHRAAMSVFPYALKAVRELTGDLLDEIEVVTQAEAGRTATSDAPAIPGDLETLFILQGSLFPNTAEALEELECDGWSGMACLSVRLFNPFPEEKLLPWLEKASRIVLLDRSNSFGSIPPLASRVLAVMARFGLSGGQDRKKIRILVGGLGGREIKVDEMKDIFLSTHLLFDRPEAWERSLIAEWIGGDETLMGLLAEAAALGVRASERHTRVPDRLRAPDAWDEEFRRELERLQRMLSEKDYPSFLANYNQVEFVAPREMFEETMLLQQIVLYLEVRLARHALESGTAGPKHALILLKYSRDDTDQDRAKELAKTFAKEGSIPGNLARGFGVVAAPLPAGPVAVLPPEPPAGAYAGEPSSDAVEAVSAPPPCVPFDAEEARRIEEALTAMVTRHEEEPLFFNPEDYEHALLNRLGTDPRSQLHGLLSAPAHDADGLTWAYQCTYRDAIDRTLQREILSRHHAPELRGLFEGEGHARLLGLAERLNGLLSEKEPEQRRKALLEELERYLKERSLAGCPKAQVFYLEHFRTWIAPGILDRFAPG